VNSAKYAYVVMSKRQMLLDGVSLADWATVTNTAPERRPLRESKTGILKAVLARSANLPRQMSGFSAHGFTIGDPHVDVVAYGGTASIQGDCTGLANS
jgi:hypothetical protein